MVLSEAGMNCWKVFDRLCFVLKKGEGVSAAQLNNKPVLKAENESQIIDEYERSKDIEDLNEEDRKLLELLEKIEPETQA